MAFNRIALLFACVEYSNHGHENILVSKSSFCSVENFSYFISYSWHTRSIENQYIDKLIEFLNVFFTNKIVFNGPLEY
jgi:hypothetical protein